MSFSCSISGDLMSSPPGHKASWEPAAVASSDLKGHLPQNLAVWEGRVGYESCEKSFPKCLLVFRIRSRTRCIRPKISSSYRKYFTFLLSHPALVASSCVLCSCQIIKDHLPFNFLHKISSWLPKKPDWTQQTIWDSRNEKLKIPSEQKVLLFECLC